jgi:hypothetical protein
MRTTLIEQTGLNQRADTMIEEILMGVLVSLASAAITALISRLIRVFTASAA